MSMTSFARPYWYWFKALLFMLPIETLFIRVLSWSLFFFSPSVFSLRFGSLVMFLCIDEPCKVEVENELLVP